MQIDFTETELLTIESILLSGYPSDDSIEIQIVKKIQSATCTPPKHKRVIVTHCDNKLQFVKALFECIPKKSLFECKSIADQLVKDGKCNGALLLNESSITPIEWEEIARNTPDLKWEYV